MRFWKSFQVGPIMPGRFSHPFENVQFNTVTIYNNTVLVCVSVF